MGRLGKRALSIHKNREAALAAKRRKIQQSNPNNTESITHQQSNLDNAEYTPDNTGYAPNQSNSDNIEYAPHQSTPENNEYAPHQQSESEETEPEDGYCSKSSSDSEDNSDSDETDEFTDEEDLETFEFDEALFAKELARGGEDAFIKLHDSAREETAFSQIFRYQRGPQPSARQQRRNVKKEKDLQDAAKGCISLDSFFKNSPAKPPPTQSPEEIRCQQRDKALEDLARKLGLKSTTLTGQNLVRHQAVLSYLKLQVSRSRDETRKSLASTVARCYGKGGYFANQIIRWEKTWISERRIEEGRQGCHRKIKSWLNDEGVALAVRNWISNTGEQVTAYGLAKAIGEYLNLRESISALQETFTPNGNRRTKRIRARTARRWLRKLGFKYDTVKKGVFVDGHERADVVDYRQKVFLPKWREYQRRLVVFDEDGNWSPPSTLLPGEKPLVLCTHDESTFNANDGKREVWMEEGKPPIRPKGRGKGIMVSGFLTPGGLLSIPESISDAELLRNEVDWPLLNGKPVRDGLQLLEYGKDNYWNGDKMVDHAVKVAARIFSYAFPGCQGLFAFDNASNHCSFAADALVASKMNLNPGGSQPLMRQGYIHSRQHSQSMVFPDDPDIPSGLRGKAKGLEQVLRERGLWRKHRSDGFLFRLQCPTTHGRPGCTEIEGGCCARSVIAAERDFKEQKGRLEEELNALGHEVIFYPKFHCELNFIERYWCSCKQYTREHCMYTFKSLQEQLPMALRSVGKATINRYFMHSMRILDAYEAGHRYGTKEFSQTVYKGHRQVVDKSKW